ncbi:hypothetical protein MJG53_009138 [Ovis ammon polii x Ovis aries]|uniref:Uncharacterized protein n=1 Tax=Ovis ammon polii x Ovis aries TaxID=2918886 RepID=A0ACB9UYA0_9CETA|nr:hypothetical protein MJG53_009138 [Ovis ammon polii x Ovis aries]
MKEAQRKSNNSAQGQNSPSTEWHLDWCKFFSLIKTPEDYTIIVDEEGFLELPSSEHLGVADATWLALSAVSGSGSFSSFQPIGMTEIVKSFMAPMTNQNICVHAVHLPDGLHPGVKTLAAENLSITHCFMKAEAVQRPIIHPLSSPSNRLCVTSLDSDIPPTVATLLMDVTFYSSGLKDRLVSSSGNCGPTRFSFSLIEGYISLVMDEQTQQRFPSNLLFTSASRGLWKMVRIGGQALGFDKCIEVARISKPLATADTPTYYSSTFKFLHTLVPEENISALKVRQAEK